MLGGGGLRGGEPPRNPASTSVCRYLFTNEHLVQGAS